jgi:enamine deaminase RidA (YjgF/YER057c/UK114 family)
MEATIQHINPDGMLKSPAFSQAVITSGTGKTIYIGGQNAVDADGRLVGQGNIQQQTVQVMKNIETALTACGATFDHVVSLNIFLVQGQDAASGFQAARPFMAKASHPPVVTVLFVAALGNPDYLVEINATAFAPGGL